MSVFRQSYLLLLLLFQCCRCFDEDISFPSDSFNGRINAFGDFNGDKHVDVFTVTNNRHSIDVWLWNITSKRFHRNDNAHIDIPSSTDNVILNIIAADFSFDGYVDILVMYQSSSMDTTFISLLLCERDMSGGLASWTITPFDDMLMRIQPIAFDITGDGFIDLYGENALGDRTIWINDKNMLGFSAVPAATIMLLQQPLMKLNPLLIQHSNAAVDIDGDCVADILVTSEASDGIMLEIWINKRNGSFVLAEEQSPVFNSAGQLSFIDVDMDGTLDVVFPVCEPISSCSDNSSISIFLNLPSLTEVDCVARPDWHFMFSSNTLLSDVVATQAPDSVRSVVKDIEKFNIFSPVPSKYLGGTHGLIALRFGDYDADGFPDVLALVRDRNTDLSIPILLKNVLNDEKRPFRVASESTIMLNSFKNTPTSKKKITPIAATFFDIGDNGSLDVLVVTETVGDNVTYGVRVLRNSLFGDVFFLKITVLNGTSISSTRKRYGASSIGASVRFSIFGVDGKRHIGGAMQLPQSSFLALQTPYIVFGLGRTSNYVERLEVGISHGSNIEKLHVRSWTMVIPNSQLAITPFPLDEPEKWSLELFITPSRLVIWVIVAVLSTCGVLAITIGIMHWRERREDDAEKRRNAHLFHFEAM